MSPSDSDREREEYRTVTLDDQGRVTIPADLRTDLGLDAGAEFTVLREGAEIRLVSDGALATLTRGDGWGPEAFRDAGDATFGGD